MFTGIVTAVGTVRRMEPRQDGGIAVEIAAPYRGLEVGESVAFDGACLTVTRPGRGRFRVEIVPTTIERTLFGGLETGRRVNLERALEVGERLGGHLVQGHVDGIATVTAVRRRADGSWLLDLRVPRAVAEVSIPLGSVTVAGVSLTVNAIPRPGIIQVSLIPHTLAVTTLGALGKGDRVHVEGDVIGKYVQALVAPRVRTGRKRVAGGRRTKR